MTICFLKKEIQSLTADINLILVLKNKLLKIKILDILFRLTGIWKVNIDLQIPNFNLLQ